MLRFEKSILFSLVLKVFGLIVVYASSSISQASNGVWSTPQEIQRFTSDYETLRNPLNISPSISIDSEGNWHVVYGESALLEGEKYYYIKYINNTTSVPLNPC